MNARLRTSHIVLAGLATALATITACSSPETAEETNPAKTTQASSVTIDLKDGAGKSLGQCSGTLIGPKMVLTAGHCVAGVNQWEITSTAGKSSATTASTPWRVFGSNLAQPEFSDVGLILLKDAIKLKSYPALANKSVKDGAKGTVFMREANGKTAVGSSAILKAGDKGGFKLNYLVELPKGEQGKTPDGGGAVLDSNGKIIGVVSGAGVASNMLHVARVDGFSGWAKSALSCSSAATTATWGGGSGGNGGKGYGGTPEPAQTGGGGWGGGGGGWGGGGWGGGGGGWGSSSGGYGGGGGKGDKTKGMEPGDVVPGSGGKGNPDGPDGIPNSGDEPGAGGKGNTPGSTPGSTTNPGGVDPNGPDGIPGTKDDPDPNGPDGMPNTGDEPGKPGAPGSEPNSSEVPVSALPVPNTCPGTPACIGTGCGAFSNEFGSSVSTPGGTPGSGGTNTSAKIKDGPDGIPGTADDVKPGNGPDGEPGTSDDVEPGSPAAGPNGIPGDSDDPNPNGPDNQPNSGDEPSNKAPTTGTPGTPGSDEDPCEGGEDGVEVDGQLVCPPPKNALNETSMKFGGACPGCTSTGGGSSPK